MWLLQWAINRSECSMCSLVLEEGAVSIVATCPEAFPQEGIFSIAPWQFCYEDSMDSLTLDWAGGGRSVLPHQLIFLSQGLELQGRGTLLPELFISWLIGIPSTLWILSGSFDLSVVTVCWWNPNDSESYKWYSEVCISLYVTPTSPFFLRSIYFRPIPFSMVRKKPFLIVVDTAGYQLRCPCLAHSSQDWRTRSGSHR